MSISAAGESFQHSRRHFLNQDLKAPNFGYSSVKSLIIRLKQQK